MQNYLEEKSSGGAAFIELHEVIKGFTLWLWPILYIAPSLVT
jgi:hypothetical protein